jgi:hypothetical protein
MARLARSEGVSDALDVASLALTLASLTLSAVLCALCFAHPSLAWAGVALLVAAVAAPVAVGSIILARNHWLIVVLRYCCSVSGLQADSGLSLAAVRPPALRRCLSALLSAALALVGLVVAAYLSACYVVRAQAGAVGWALRLGGCTALLCHEALPWSWSSPRSDSRGLACCCCVHHVRR